MAHIVNDGGDWHGFLLVVSFLTSVTGRAFCCGTRRGAEIGSVCVFVLRWKNRALGSDTVKMTERSDVSDSHGTAGRAKLQPEQLRWETAEVSLRECYVGVTRIV